MAFWDKWWKDSKRQETEPAVQDTVEEEKVLEEESAETPVEAVTVETPTEAVTEEVQEPVEEEPEPEAPGPAEPPAEEKKVGFWQKLKKLYMGDVFGSAISEADEAFFDDLEEMLILADIGMESSIDAVKELRQRMIEDKISGQEPVKACLREILEEKLQVGDTQLNLSTQPSVILVIGVNGVGKTTSIGKLANRLRKQGKRVLLCAGDTFRLLPPTSWRSWATVPTVSWCARRREPTPGAVLF